MHLTHPDGYTPQHVQLQCMEGGEMEDAQKVQEGRRRIAQNSKAAHEVKKGDTASPRIYSSQTGGSERAETDTRGRIDRA